MGQKERILRTRTRELSSVKKKEKGDEKRDENISRARRKEM